MGPNGNPWSTALEAGVGINDSPRSTAPVAGVGQNDSPRSTVYTLCISGGRCWSDISGYFINVQPYNFMSRMIKEKKCIITFLTCNYMLKK